MSEEHPTASQQATPTQPTAPQAAPKKRVASSLIALGAVSAIALATAFGFAIEGPTNAQPVTLPEAAQVHPGAPATLADLVERVSPAVVSIQVKEKASVTSMERDGDQPDVGDLPEEFRRFFGPDFQFRVPRGNRPARISEGSGFIIDPSGYIVTNNHVVEGGDNFEVTMTDGTVLPAKLIGTDAATDVALIKVEAKGTLPYVEFADDSKVRVGDYVVAVGNPFGLGGSVTSGIVSARGRNVNNGPYTDFFQIDAPINQGNSGGPTFDLTGKVIGVNSIIISPSGGNVGIGFAIPASTVQRVVGDLRTSGSVTRGWLGVGIQSIDKDLASSLGLEKSEGALVSSVEKGSPAEKAGFKPGDVVTKLNGEGIKSSRDLARLVANLAPGAKADFTIWRGNAETTLSADISKRKSDVQEASLTGEDSGTESLGLSLAELTPALKQRFGIESDQGSVVVTKVVPGTEAAEKGLQPGDVILDAGGDPVTSAQSITKAVDEAKSAGNDTVLLRIARDGSPRFVALKVKQS